MCPLRIILIFLSATLAGFFVLRNLNSQPVDLDDATDTKTKDNNSTEDPSNSPPLSSKVRGVVVQGFWTCVDMASGRYLWRNLVGSQSSSTSKPAHCSDS